MFPRFINLPPELRQMIWKFAHEEPLIHYVKLNRHDNPHGDTCDIYPSYHGNLNLACGESREAGKRLRIDYLHPEHDTIYLDVACKPEDFPEILQSLEISLARRLALNGPREWRIHDTGELISRFPYVTEIFVIRRPKIEMGGNLQGEGLIGYRASLGEQWPCRGLWWDGLMKWQMSMVRKFGGGLDIQEANAT